jgi:hypothetical protein
MQSHRRPRTSSPFLTCTHARLPCLAHVNGRFRRRVDPESRCSARTAFCAGWLRSRVRSRPDACRARPAGASQHQRANAGIAGRAAAVARSGLQRPAKRSSSGEQRARSSGASNAQQSRWAAVAARSDARSSSGEQRARSSGATRSSRSGQPLQRAATRAAALAATRAELWRNAQQSRRATRRAAVAACSPLAQQPQCAATRAGGAGRSPSRSRCSAQQPQCAATRAGGAGRSPSRSRCSAQQSQGAATRAALVIAGTGDRRTRADARHG